MKNNVVVASVCAMAILGFSSAAAWAKADEREASNSPRWVEACQELQGATYNLTVFAPEGMRVEDFTFTFSPKPEHVLAKSIDSRTQAFNLAPGQYTLTTKHVAERSETVTSVDAASCSLNGYGYGMTWRVRAKHVPTGVITVGCGYNPTYGNECNAYSGDTSCARELPILCILKSGPGFPLVKPVSVDNLSSYYRWSGGIVGTTRPTLPPDTLAAANAMCVQEFGANWRVAEFHDGSGWNFRAYGDVGYPSKRFWVHIDDQPANCWTP